MACESIPTSIPPITGCGPLGVAPDGTRSCAFVQLIRDVLSRLQSLAELDTDMIAPRKLSITDFGRTRAPA